MSKESKIEKQKTSLIELKLMEPEDTLVDFLYGNYVEKLPLKIKKWSRCWIYFTDKKLICLTDMFGGSITIPYENIKQLEKCSQGLFPMGIAITYESPENGELTEDRFSMSGRQKWLDFLSEKAGV